MRKIILSLLVFICVPKDNVIAQYWSAVGNGIGNLITVQNSDGFVDGYDAPVTGPPVASMCVYKGELYAAGFFDFADGPANNIAKWNGTKWMPVGSGVYTVGGGGVDSWVNVMLVYNEELYVGGRFTDAGSVEVNNIAKWNGTEWSAVGTGLGSYGYSVGSLAVFNGDLYAGGHFYNSGNIQTNNIAKWNGINWSPLGTGIKVYTDDYFSGSLSSLAVYNGALYAGGYFDTAGSVPANNIAKWDGSNWSAVGSGTDSMIFTLQVYNGEIYAGGYFHDIRKWDGANWSPLTSGINGSVYSLSVYNGSLIVGGYFDTAGSVTVKNIAKWDGINWSSIGNGFDNGVLCMITHDSTLYVGGNFKTAGNVWANRVAKWAERCTSVPPQPTQIIEWGTACKNHYAGYYINPVTDASDFTWTIPPGWSGSSISNRITVLAGTNGGTISVTANNPCGSSNPQTIIVAPRDTVPSLLEPIIGNNSVCVNTAQTYSVNPVPAATNYMWILPSGWMGHSTTNTITTTVGISGGEISVRARNGCSESNAQTFSVAINAAPQPGVISGNNSVCQYSSQTYSISPVPGATGYTWNLPSGWTGSSATTIINAAVGSANGIVSVTANNICGSSTAQTLTVTVNNIPPQPGAINGNNSVCQYSSQTYSISPVPGATSYTWNLPSGWTGSSATTTINAAVGSTNGIVSVTANNICGSGTAQTLAVSVINNIPPQPGAINGNNSVCQNSSQTYSINPVPSAVSYTWVLPSGWTGSSATTSINTTAGNTNGNITVIANNSCGNSNAQTLAVSVGVLPAQPDSITGNKIAGTGQTITYSINPVIGANSYLWSLNGGGMIVSGQNTNSIIVNWQTPGNYVVSVKASNSCGTSMDQTLAITVSVATGVINPGNSFEIKLFPNPSSGEFYLKAKGVQNKIINVEVLNMTGQLVFRSGKRQGANDYSQLINLDKMAMGLYAVKIMIDDKVYVRSVMIKH